MSLRLRRKLFYSLVVLFVLVSASVVAYSQGWRIDSKNCPDALTSCFRFQKIGGIYIETLPRGVQIFLDEKEIKDQSGILRNGTLITNLTPHAYELKIQKGGYLPWNKFITVAPSLVTDASRVVLIPKTIPIKAVPLPLGFPTPITNVATYGNQRIFTSGSSTMIYVVGGTTQKLRGTSFVDWNINGTRFITYDDSQKVHYLYNTENLRATNLTSVVQEKLNGTAPLQKVGFHTFDSEKIFITYRGTLYIYDASRAELARLLGSPTRAVLDWKALDRNVYAIVRAEPFPTSTPVVEPFSIVAINLILGTETTRVVLKEIDSTPTSLTPSPGGTTFVVTTSKTLYLVNPSKTACCIPLGNTKAPFAFAPDDKRLAYLGANETLMLYFVRATDGSERFDAGTIVPLHIIPDTRKITWFHNGRYVFIESGVSPNSSIKMAEIDIRPPLQSFPLFETSSDFHYESQTNTLSFIKGGLLYTADFLQ